MPLADVFENLRNMSLKIYEFDPAKFYGILKNTKVKLDLLSDIDMLLTVEKVLEEEYVTLFIDMKKLIKLYERL